MDKDQLRALRQSCKLTITQAAAAVHVSSRTWARWEAGTRHFPPGVVELFCLKHGIKYAGKDLTGRP